MAGLQSALQLVVVQVLVGAAVLPAPAGPVSRCPPAAYAARLQQRLSAPPSGPRPAAAAPSGGAEGTILLDEEIILVRPDGSSVVAIHRVLEPLDSRGAARASRIIFPYVPRVETVHLVSAERITPDERRIPVPHNGVLQEIPQPLADRRIHVDVAQVAALLPGVRPGDRVEYILVKEVEATIGDRYAAFLPIADPWPIERARRELVIPADMSEDLAVVPLGLPGLVHDRSPTPTGEVSRVWTVTSLPAQRLERGRAPIRQAGPGIWLSTLAGWEEVGTWYRDLASETAELPSDIARAAAGSAGTGDTVALSRELTRMVSTRIDYVSLTLGMGSLRPRPAAEVWSSRWGDCKDQANLLRALLRNAGVPADLALVSTDHAGRIPEDAPDYRHFNHVIVVVPPDQSRGLIVCDPTAGTVSTGTAPPWLADRPALLVRNDGGVLIDLPPAQPEGLELELDLELTPDMELFGWLHVGGHGHQATSFVASLGEADGDSLKSFLEGLFPAAEVLDRSVRAGPDATSVLDLYVHALAAPGTGGVHLPAPHSSILLPDVGDDERRQTAFWWPRGSLTVTATFRLPPGWGLASSLPEDLRIDVGSLRATGSWTGHGSSWTVTYTHHSLRSLVGPVAFVALHRASGDLVRWLEQPVVVSRAEAADGDDGGSPDLPALSSGRAQLRLVDARFPREGPPAGRREAMRLVQELFPSDPATIVEAGCEIAILDLDSGLAGRAVRDLQDLLATHGHRVSQEVRGWAEYLLADGMRRCGRREEARQLYLHLAGAADQPVARRGWSSARAADLTMDQDPMAAYALLDEALLVDSPALTQQVALLVEILLLTGSPADVVARQVSMVATRFPHHCVDIHTRLLDEVSGLLDRGDLTRAEILAGVLELRLGACPELDFLAGSVERARHLVARTRACRAVASEMADALSASTPPWWCDVSLPSPLERDPLIHNLQRWDQLGESKLFVRGAVELLTRWTVTPDFFVFLVGRSLHHAERIESGSRLGMQLRDWGHRLASQEGESGSAAGAAGSGGDG